MSLTELFIHGIEIGWYQIYNLDPLIQSKLEGLKVNLNYYFVQSPWSIQYYYIKYLVPLLEYGLVFILLSFLMKLSFFIIIYNLLKSIINNQNQCLFVTVLFVIASTIFTRGLTHNGISGSPFIMPATISTLLSILGLGYLFKGKFLIASIPLSLSIHFHPLYALSFLGFVIIGFILIEWKINNFKFTRDLLTSGLIILLNIAYIAFFSGFTSVSADSSPLSVQDWYKMMYPINPDDVFLTESILMVGQTLLPPIFFATYITIKKSKKNTEDYFMIGLFLAFMLFLFIELVHVRGFFFGALSEYFISLQFRRGTWIIALFSLVIIVKNNKFIFGENLTWRFKLLIFIVISMYLRAHGLLNPVVYSIFFLMIFLKSKDKAFILLSLIPIILIFLSSQKYYSFMISALSTHFIYLLIVTAAAWLILLLNKNLNLNKIAMISIGTYLLFNFSYASIVANKFSLSAKSLFNNGILGKTDYFMLANKQNSNLDIKVSEYLNKLPVSEKKDYYMIIPHKISTYSDPSFYGISIYYFRIDEVSPIYSPLEYVLSYNKLIDLYGKDSVDYFHKTYINNKSNSEDYFDILYEKLRITDLKNLFIKSNIRYYTSLLPRNDLKEIKVCEGNNLFLYDISLLF